jgi:hypothetical protein
MDQELNLDSIRALEKQIREHERAIIKLKRARNSLLNVSTRLPPEVLGSIFRWNVIPGGDFGGLPKDSYNFLLVCHHWFEVASATPGLWGFWGNSIKDWERRHARYRAAPLDLALMGRPGDHLDDKLRDALQDRAARGIIRRVHLHGIDATALLSSVISSIITKGEETRTNSVESFVLVNINGPNVDISDFFSRYHFPKLRHLRLFGCRISSWDLLGSRITSLTTLSLASDGQSPLPTPSQILSILSASPNLQSLALDHRSVPDVDGDRSSKIQLCRLETLQLSSSLRRVFGLLDRLEIPEEMDKLDLSLSGCSPSDFLQTIGPYLGNRVRRRSPGGLRLRAFRSYNFFSVLVGDAHEEGRLVRVDGTTSMILGEEEADKLCFDVIAHIPQKEVVDVTMPLPILRSEELCVQMCNVTHLHLEDADLSTWFVEPDTREPHVFKNLLPMLRSITITEPNLSGGDWSPLTNFLTRRAAVGNRISSLSLGPHPHMGEAVVECIRRAVDVFEDEGSYYGGDDGSDSGSSDGY